MVKFVLRQNKNEQSSAYGKWYAYPQPDETMDLAALAKHMEEHNTGFSEAMCTGVMKAMVKCIKEQILSGKNVKIDDLAIFSIGLKNRMGSATPEEFSVATNIEGVKLRARATGILSNAQLTLSASLKRATSILGGTSSGSGSSGNTGGSNDNTGGGSSSGGSGDDLPGYE
ncbi:MAG: DNA-binding protein [Bacteroides sp.]